MAIYHMDNFLTMGKTESKECEANLDVIVITYENADMPSAREDGRPSHNNRVPGDGIGHASDGDPPAKGKSRHLENSISGGKG